MPSTADSAASQRPAWEERAVEQTIASARRRSAARAHQLVDAARALAAERGSDFTVAQVADRAGVALRTFYRHFPGRDELLLALFEEEARQGAELLAATDVDADARSPLDALHAFVTGMCQLLEVGSGYASLLVREHVRLAETHPRELRVALEPMVGLLEAHLEAAAADGALRPVDRHDAVVVFTTIQAHVHASVLITDDEDIATSAERLWEFCYAALRNETCS